jgi:streptogramin lyase
VLDHGVWSHYDGKQGLPHENVLAVHEDREGNLWLGTRLGLVRLTPKQVRTLTERDGLANDYVNAVLESRAGELWVATQNGVSRRGRDDRWRTFRVSDGLPHATVTSIAEAEDGTLWFGTVNGLARYRDGRFTAHGDRLKGYRIAGLAVSPSGQPWATVTDGSLYRLVGDTLERVSPRLCDDPYLRHVLFDRSGQIWIGGTASLIRGRGEPMQWTCLSSHDEPVAANDIRYLRQDTDGSVWTAGVGGIARFRTNGTIERFRGSNGPFDSIVYSLIEDERGHLWCSTPKGVFRIVARTLHSDAVDEALYRHYGRQEGLETSACNGDGEPTAWRGSKGRLYFTSVKGLVVVDTTTAEPGVTFPAVYLQKVEADQVVLEPRSPLPLAPGTREIEIHYAAVSLSQGSRMRYRYRLDPTDEDAAWTEAGTRRVAYFANLRPGRHRFEVSVMNRDGAWSPQAAALDLELKPRFYEHAWFYPLLAVALATLAVFGYRLRVAHLRHRAEALERRVHEAIASIRELRSLLPTCAWCRKVRDDGGYWSQLEAYISHHWGTDLSHGICPECLEKVQNEIDHRRIQG